MLHGFDDENPLTQGIDAERLEKMRVRVLGPVGMHDEVDPFGMQPYRIPHVPQ